MPYMKDYEGHGPRYLDVNQLSERGWTKALIEQFLGEEDMRIPVNHFMNFSGKGLWQRGRVGRAERTASFRAALERSLARRGKKFAK